MATLTTADHNIARLHDQVHNGHEYFEFQPTLKFDEDGDIIFTYLDEKFVLKVEYDDN